MCITYTRIPKCRNDRDIEQTECLREYNMSFKSLVSAISEQRQEIKQALTLFPYFDTWDSRVVAECCELSKITEFSPDEIILGSDSTNSHSTFFILEGVCKIIHHLLVTAKVNSYGKTILKLYKPEKCENTNFKSTSMGYTSLLLKEKHVNFNRDEKSDQHQVLFPRMDPENDKKGQLDGINKMDEYDENYIGFEEFENEIDGEEIENEKDNTGTHKHDSIKNNEIETHVNGKQFKNGNPSLKPNDFVTSIEGSNFGQTESTDIFLDQRIVNADEDLMEEKDPGELDEKVKELVHKTAHRLNVLDNFQAKSEKIFLLSEEKLLSKKPENVKSIFVQVALFYKGACFGLEENTKDTFVISVNKVKCLKIPRRFLMQHNPCNIWNRIRLFFSMYLPQEKQILEYIKTNRNWNNMKKKKLEEIVSVKRIPNHVLCTEVPFSIQLQDVFY